jgi:plasmid maintenance system killer protein
LFLARLNAKAGRWHLSKKNQRWQTAIALASGGFSAKVARRKLVMLNAALKLNDLKSPPGNMLEALRGNLKGKHSTRVNDKWRIVFKWTEEGPEDVEIDYGVGQ